jgi:hypothetical protein
MTDAEKDSKPTATSTTPPGEGKSCLQVALPCSDSIEFPAPQANKPEVAQVTLSTLSDVSMAANAAMDRVGDVREGTRWVVLLGFFFLVYLATSLFAIKTLDAAPWIRAFVVPLFPVAVATIAFWWRQRWKWRSKGREFQLKTWQDALSSLVHEAANGVNAVRANLIAFRMANPDTALPEHLEQIELAAQRIDHAVQNSQNPLAWKHGVKKGLEQGGGPSVAEATRSQIAL